MSSCGIAAAGCPHIAGPPLGTAIGEAGVPLRGFADLAGIKSQDTSVGSLHRGPAMCLCCTSSREGARTGVFGSCTKLSKGCERVIASNTPCLALFTKQRTVW